MRQFEAREVSNALWSFTILRREIVTPTWLDQALDHFLDLVRRCEYEGWELVQVVNSCWPYRHELDHWGHLQQTFQQKVFQRVVSALEAIIGRDQGLLGMSEPLPLTETLPQKLLKLGIVHKHEHLCVCTACKCAYIGCVVELGHRTCPLRNAGPATHGSLAARMPPRLSPLEAARRGAQRLIDELQAA